MSVREPKSKMTTLIEVVGRQGSKKGWLELTSGNVNYYRAGAKTQTLSLSYQQLFEVLERELEYQAIDPENFQLPRDHKKGDFAFEVIELDEAGDPNLVLSSRSSISRVDPRRVDGGAYQFSHDMANGRVSKKYTWFAHVSIQAALWIIDRYIDKFLLTKKKPSHTDEDVVVSKQQMRNFLTAMLKKL